MNWNEVRKSYRDRWLLVEALRARSEQGYRILEDLSVLASFSDSTSAWREYVLRHRQLPERELYVLHTSRETLEITERTWFGIRGSR
jgi:hypothetical protein